MGDSRRAAAEDELEDERKRRARLERALEEGSRLTPWELGSVTIGRQEIIRQSRYWRHVRTQVVYEVTGIVIPTGEGVVCRPSVLYTSTVQELGRPRVMFTRACDEFLSRFVPVKKQEDWVPA